MSTETLVPRWSSAVPIPLTCAHAALSTGARAHIRSYLRGHAEATAQGRDSEVRAPPDAAPHGAPVDDRLPAWHDRRTDGGAREPRPAARARGGGVGGG